MKKAGIEIRVLGDWQVIKDGTPVLKQGGTICLILHALVMSGGELQRSLLYELLGWNAWDPDDQHKLRQQLYELRQKLNISIDGKDPVRLVKAELAVDLWQVLAWVEEDPAKLTKAQALIKSRGEPFLFSGNSDREFEAWKTTLDEFDEAKEMAFAAPPPPDAGAARYVRETCDALLKHNVVPEVIGQRKIGEVRTTLQQVKAMRFQETGRAEEPKAKVLADFLEGRRSDHGSWIVLTGGSGAGKAVTAVLTYLELADRFETTDEPELVPVFIDAMKEVYTKDFGTNKWFKRFLKSAGVTKDKEPVVVMTHAEAFFAKKDEIRPLLAWDLFQSKRLLLCCGSTFYTRRLYFKELDADAVWLDPWSREFQEDFVLEVTDEKSAEQFRAWLDGDRTRVELCKVPLHLVFVLSLLEEPSGLDGVSTPVQLFEAVARLRLKTAGEEEFDLDDRLAQLGAVAHCFYVDAKATSGPPIQFKRTELMTMLGKGPASVAEDSTKWAEELEYRTLLTSTNGDDPLSFEHPGWGPFFVARHIVSTLRERPAETLRTFSKFLSVEVATRCEELLEEAADRDPDSLRRALKIAIDQDDPDLGPYLTRIAREQIFYFLGAIGHRLMRADLFRLVDSEAYEYETDPLLRRAILFGLADGGSFKAADLYVDMLRDERDAGGNVERDTNIGFLLTFRGDQPYQAEKPDAIAPQAHCTRTVEALVRGLDQGPHAGSRRIKLFTLIELGRNPLIDAEVYAAAVRPLLDTIAEIRDRLAASRRSQAWPELAEVDKLLEKHRNVGR